MKKKMKKALVPIQLLYLLFFALPLALADDSDIFGTNVQPNVMLLIDSSQSMDDEVPSNPYAPGTTYSTPLTYDTVKVYQKFTTTGACKPAPRPCYKVYANSIADVTDAAARDALHNPGPPPTGTGYWSGRIGGSNVDLFYGNYLNYLACTSCSVLEAKIVIAKRVLSSVVNNVNGIRFGAMKFSAGGGAMILEIADMTAANKSALVTAINGMPLTSVGTPTGEQIKHSGNYYSGNFAGYSSPIQFACQPNFSIVISDGLYTGTDPRLEATDLFSNPATNDHSSLPGVQNVIVHTIGFALPPGEVNAGLAALQETATNGGGSFYTANTSAQLEQAIQDAITQILAATFSFATPVIPTTSTTGSTRAYFASFKSDPVRPFWQGYLKAYNRDANGLIPVDANGLPTGTPAWEAGAVLNSKPAANRTIYTVVSGTRQSFTTGNTAITETLLGVASADRVKVIDFIRGIDTYDDNLNKNPTEERAWKLGDIFHSTPVLVSKPFLPLADQSYKDFKTANASRTMVLLAGANDGMLHAFRESDGEELWGFIPPDLLDNLKDLVKALTNSSIHPYLVDSSPIAADVCVKSKTDGSGDCNSASDWKTIVVVGLRRGGRSYYALDITDTTNPLLLWSQSFTDSTKMGETWSEPAIGKVKMADGSAKWAAFVGGGYDTPQNNNTGKALFAIDLATGNKLWEYYNNSSTDDRRYMNFSLAANPTAVDLDSNGFVDHVYISDVGGQLWKFDVSAAATVSGGLVTNWTGKRLFAADPSQANPPAAGEYYPAQAIYGAPVLAFDKQKNLWVYFGTGDRNHPLNASSNRFYGIKENTDMTNGSYLRESDLVDVTSTNATATQGWFFRLASTEKVLATAEVFDNVVYFTTFTPLAGADPCTGGGGTARLYAVQMLTGFAAINFTTGEALTSTDSSVTRSKVIGEGIPSKPIVITNPSTGDATVIAGTTNGQLPNSPAPKVMTKRLRGWREVF